MTNRQRRRNKVTAAKPKLQPIRLKQSEKWDVRSQFGALCYRLHKGAVEVLLITSRGTGRWICPKGWPIDGVTPAQAAATEAYEEAGVEGKVSDVCLGVYSYNKNIPTEDNLPCVVAMFPLRVKRLLKDFPEAGQRKRRWFNQKKAAELVSNPELGQLIRSFDPSRLKT